LAHQQINETPELAGGFNAIGFSQGGQFLRAYVSSPPSPSASFLIALIGQVQRFNDPPVNNLITLGGQHQGVFGFPRCPGENSTLCEITRKLLNLGVYESFVQDHLVQAEYWQDPFNEDKYIEKSVFLADINNQTPNKNATYKANLLTLNLFVMVQFTEDTMVQPKESEWFVMSSSRELHSS
jgi:palmitoyl-protein thioesterase